MSALRPVDVHDVQCLKQLRAFFYRRKDRTLENLHGGDIVLTAEDMAAIARIMEENPVKGGRGLATDAIDLKLWG